MKTIQSLILSLLFSFFSTASFAQALDIREVFKSMPASFFPYLTQNNKLDLIDFCDANMEAAVTNMLDGTTRMTSLTPDSLVLQLTSVSSATIHLLRPVSADSVHTTLICITETFLLGDSLKENVLRLYTTEWEPINDYTMLDNDTKSWLMARRESAAGVKEPEKDLFLLKQIAE